MPKSPGSCDDECLLSPSFIDNKSNHRLWLRIVQVSKVSSRQFAIVGVYQSSGDRVLEEDGFGGFDTLFFS